MNKFKTLFAVQLVLLTLLVGCEKQDEDNYEVRDEDRVTISREELEKIKREDPSVPGSVVFTPSEYKGMKLFMRHCNKCHPGGEKGKGPSLNDKNLPDFLVHFQVRSGRGDMPAFKKDDISKEQLEQIILYVRLLRESK